MLFIASMPDFASGVIGEAGIAFPEKAADGLTAARRRFAI
jgi:hypothetical protein